MSVDMNVYLEKAFFDRFNIYPKTLEIRNLFVEAGNRRDFFVAQSCMVPPINEEITGSPSNHMNLGLFAKRSFKKDSFLGTYKGELCNESELRNLCSDFDESSYKAFLSKYGISSTLPSKETCKLMVQLGFFIAFPGDLKPENFLVMPRYPIEPEFYQTYNAMLYVNEPPNCDNKFNPYLKCEQPCETNVLAFTNFKWGTIDYIASRDIFQNEELLVYYGANYQRKHYSEGVKKPDRKDEKIPFSF